jgi:hypothetical protein
MRTSFAPITITSEAISPETNPAIKMKLNWTTTRQADSTHIANDDVVTYFAAAAPGITMQQVATSFLAGYDVSEKHEGEEVDFSVTNLVTEQDVRFSGLPDGEAK